MTYDTGKKYFRSYCSSCHSAHREVYGPMLGSISKKRNAAWLIAFIQNSQEVIRSGDAYAKTVFEKFDKRVMPSFKQLSQKDIQSILYYLEYESTHPDIYSDDAAIAATDNSNVVKGRQEFLAHCSVCHFIHKESDYAPALGSVTKRHEKAWLSSFIQNSQHMIKSGDVYAESLYVRFDKHVMPPMYFLSEEEINQILDYIEFASTVHAAYDGKINKTEYKNQAQKEIKYTFQSLSVLHVIFSILISAMLATVLLLLGMTLQIEKYFSHNK